MPPDPPPPVTAADDALPAISTISTWINNADTKIGLLGIVDTALTGAFVAQHSEARTAIDHASFRGDIALSLLTLGAIVLIASILTLVTALQPRLHSHDPSRFAFPWVADAELQDLMNNNREAIRREAWIEAQALARIVRTKYQRLRQALPCAVLAGALLASWLIILPPA